MQVFMDVILHKLVNTEQPFEGTHCVHLQAPAVQVLWD
jgi:hypothetical protein